MQQRTADSSLTPREIEVLVLRAQGVGIREIARRLNIKPTSVDRYLARIAAKLGFRDREFLAQYVRENNLLTDDSGSCQ